MAFRRRLQNELRDLLELVLVPGLAAILPWRFCFRVLKFLSRFEFLYKDSCAQPYAFARAHGWFQNLGLWQRHRRLVMMVDHADFYLVRFRSLRWMNRHMDVDGSWPLPDAAGMLYSFHWGCGMWALWHAGAAGLHPHPLVAPLRREMFPGRWVRFHYFRARNRAVQDALGRAPFDISVSLRPMLKALRAKEQVIALLDVPPNQVSSSQPVPFLGGCAHMPAGLLRVAVEQGLPVTLYANGFRLSDGHRFLRIMRLGVYTDLDALSRKVFGYLEDLIREEPVLWYYCEGASLFFQPAGEDDCR